MATIQQQRERNTETKRETEREIQRDRESQREGNIVLEREGLNVLKGSFFYD